jgi:hypothetical protein
MKEDVKMKRADAEKKMAVIKEAAEKKYHGVKAIVKMNEWEKGEYHRLYINLVLVCDVNGKEAVEEADFGFINLKTNRYNVKGYDMRHFGADELIGAKMLYEYAEAYKTADSDKKLYTAKKGYRLFLGLSEKEADQGVSRKEMLDKSYEMNILVSNFDMYWSIVGDNGAAKDVPEDSEDDSKKIGSYDGHNVTVKRSSGGKYVVEDDGKYTGDDGQDEDEAA